MGGWKGGLLMVTITNAAAINFSVNAPIPATDSYQAATFGANTAAGTGGWKPQLANGTVENVVGYGGLVSGSLGLHVPTISSGRLVFTGAAGCPNGAVLRLVGLSGRVYEVTLTQVANRKDIATNADITAAAGVTANLGLTLAVRQNARIPAKDRLVGGTEWLSGTTQGEVDGGFTSPITVIGEGPVLPHETGFTACRSAGEYHCYSIRSFFPSSTTIRHLAFADQKTDASLIVESGASRINRNITVDQCYFDIFYDVDGVGDWSGGFLTTGYVQGTLLFVTGGYSRDLTVTDNVFLGGYVGTNINFSGTLWYVGNYHERPYFDYRKSAMNDNAAPLGVRIEGGNFYGNPVPFSVNEPGGSEPHLDVDQMTGDDTLPVVMYDEARIVWHDTPAIIQGRFHEDRANTATAGYRWSIAGDMILINSLNPTINGWPDNVVIDRLMILPNSDASFPTGAANRFLFGTSKSGDGGTVGAHRITNSTFSRTDYAANGPTSGDVTETNVVKYSLEGDGNTFFGARLAEWASWGSLPALPTFAEALPYFAPVPASAYDGISPEPEITAGSPLQSSYTISDTLRPVPALSSLTVTDEATAAFTVVTDIATNSTVHWAVFTSEVTDPDDIWRGISAGVEAEAYGINHRGNSAGTVTGGGTASLSAGSYWLCVAQYNGPKKVDVITASFSV
jgi:hypothetical protein